MCLHLVQTPRVQSDCRAPLGGRYETRDDVDETRSMLGFDKIDCRACSVGGLQPDLGARQGWEARWDSMFQ